MSADDMVGQSEQAAPMDDEAARVIGMIGRRIEDATLVDTDPPNREDVIRLRLDDGTYVEVSASGADGANLWVQDWTP